MCVNQSQPYLGHLECMYTAKQISSELLHSFKEEPIDIPCNNISILKADQLLIIIYSSVHMYIQNLKTSTYIGNDFSKGVHEGDTILPH